MQRPKTLTDAGFDLYFDTSRLRDLPIPTEEKDIQDLIWCFDFPVWEKDGTDDWNLTPREVIENKPYASEHRKRIDAVDLSFPIVVIFNKDKWVIVDGIHRLVKAYMEGHKMVKVKIIQKDDESYKNAILTL